LTALRELDARTYPAPIFIVTGDGDVSSAVEAVKSGAYDYLVKPLDARSIVSRVRGAVATFARHDGGTGGKIALSMDVPGQRLLTPREREALTQIAEGASNKEVGRRLGISPRTVEVHRARIMEKIGARNAADLVRIVLSGGETRSLSTSEMTT
jgi:two-component system response regulator FixJ